ncbi:hypothetical protein M3A49_01065 [Paraburkholderia sp. CNPSo 3076]|uniref:hypothetical protein n=1 Tax=Paraburkholderia sp. CNPSo 3076 TaxID=2940936 RepID=UPI0022564E5B|nr:hypothetical protein [Paraburkholderia sp. CNPSo 3076]MCX5538101.1 hypothetical protein [Paraburkholderia sp. CNPSo 3076]
MKRNLTRFAPLLITLLVCIDTPLAHAQAQNPPNDGTTVSASEQRFEQSFRVPIVMQQDAQIENSAIKLVARSAADNAVLLVYSGRVVPYRSQISGEWLTLLCQAADGTIIGKSRLLKVPADARNRDYEGESGWLTLLPTYSARDIVMVRPWIIG